MKDALICTYMYVHAYWIGCCSWRGCGAVNCMIMQKQKSITHSIQWIEMEREILWTLQWSAHQIRRVWNFSNEFYTPRPRLSVCSIFIDLMWNAKGAAKWCAVFTMTSFCTSVMLMINVCLPLRQTSNAIWILVYSPSKGWWWILINNYTNCLCNVCANSKD